MNRPIKFRGCDMMGKMRFGHYAITGGHPYIIEEHVWCEVEPESVAQLVGYDINDKEVYEGDELISVDGVYEDTAKLFSNVCDSDKLKEAKS